MQQALNARLVKELSIPLPPLLERYEIIQRCNFYLSMIESTEKNIESTLYYSDVLRKSILARAFNGELVPENPNDEPVLVLLEKIRQEKSTVENRNNSQRSGKNKSGSKQMRLV